MKLITDLGVVYQYATSKRRIRVGLYQCPSCLGLFRLQPANVKNSKSSSCHKCTVTKHGMVNTRVYKCWESMLSRCHNKTVKTYKYYGGKGVTVCSEWKEDFQVFYKWAKENGYNDSLTLDRIDSDGDYKPNNCRWADRYTQSINQKKRVNNTSGYIGVSLYARDNVYVAALNVKGKKIWLGRHQTALEAAQARDNYITNNNTGHPLNLTNER